MRTTSLQDRVTIVTLAEAGHTDRDIAQRVGFKLSTVRKWRRRGQREGLQALESQMGRPKRGPLSTFPLLIQQVLQTWCHDHPGWGAKTLRAEFESCRPSLPQSLPSRATIARWRKENGLTRRYEPHRQLPLPPPSSATAPHEEWELDARGYQKVPEVGVVSLINLSDRFSRVKLLSYPCWLGEKRASRHPTTEDYQLVLRLGFVEWGLPDRLFVDRDSVFYDNLSQSPFPTRLHLWLLALGTLLIYGPAGRPTKRAMIERGHQTWEQQVLQGQTFADWQGLSRALRQRRDFLNEWLPCATLGDVPPLIAYPQARTPRRVYRPEWEPELLDLSRVYSYLSRGQWFRKASNIGAVSLGTQRYTLGKAWARKEVEIAFDPTDKVFVFRSQPGGQMTRCAVKGIEPVDLMGKLGPLVGLESFQLALPFTPHEWRMIRLCETMGDTTY